MAKRKQLHAVRQNQFIDCDVDILNLIKSSNHVMKCKCLPSLAHPFPL